MNISLKYIYIYYLFVLKNFMRFVRKRKICYISNFVNLKLMMPFQSELGLSVLDLLGRSAVSGRWAPLQKQETKRIGRGSSVASLMPKSILSEGREDQLLREWISVLKSAYLSLIRWHSIYNG